jgi:multicomponent Na+:H+ antiporter subunit F
VTAVLYAVALVLAGSMGLGLLRVALGPSTADRLSASLLLGSTGVGLLAVLSVLTDTPTLRDVALVLVVLSALVVVVFVGPEVTAAEAEPGEDA